MILNKLWSVKKNVFTLVLTMLMLGQAVAADFLPVRFGQPKKDAVSAFTQLWGCPVETTENTVTFYNVELDGFCFDRVVLGFEEVAHGGYFNQARLFITRPVRRQAVVLRDSLARTLSTQYGYGITRDYEENGNKFYKGGVSPEGIGFLFTIYTQRRQGLWSTELRYGAFHKLKR